MNIIRRIKNNRFIRGAYFLYKFFFGYKRKNFGYLADSVVITPPPFYNQSKECGDRKTCGNWTRCSYFRT